MGLNTQQKRDTSAVWANSYFVTKGLQAIYSVDDIQAAVSSIDNAFDTTISQAQTAGFGNMTVIQAINANIPAPFNGATLQQKIDLACYVLMKRAGII